jgi:hypothetical protein
LRAKLPHLPAVGVAVGGAVFFAVRLAYAGGQLGFLLALGTEGL